MMDQGLGKFQLDPDEVAGAREHLYPHIRVTPILRSTYDPEVVFKAENLQVTGSFKIRSALMQTLSLAEEAARRGLVTSGCGNFALATAWASQRLGLSAKIVMPRSSSGLKIDRVKSWGGEIVFCDDQSEAASSAVSNIVRAESRTAIEPSDDQLAIVGDATIGLEILEQYPQVENIAVPIGGGGLISGIASITKALKPSIRIWGVQPEGSNAAYLSFKAKAQRKVERPQSVADGLTVARLGDVTFPLVLDCVDDVVTVSEESILCAVRRFAEEERLIVEPSGAVTLAAALEQKVPRQRTVLIISGGNVSNEMILRALSEDDGGAPEEA
jgi:threonine dehydratase